MECRLYYFGYYLLSNIKIAQYFSIVIPGQFGEKTEDSIPHAGKTYIVYQVTYGSVDLID